MDIDLLNNIYENDIAIPQDLGLLSRLTFDEAADADTRATSDIDTSLTASLSVSNQAGAVIAKIEKIFEAIVENISSKKNVLTIQLNTRKPSRSTGQLPKEEEKKARAVSFPNKNPKEAWKFTVLLRILELSHEALVTGIVTTKRDIYYKDPELFIKQEVVNRYVDDIAYTFGVERHALNVVAAAKGLIAGYMKATRKDGSLIDFSAEPEGILIPNANDLQSIDLSHTSWILVIEKEATFRTLATSQYWKHSSTGHGILITAKGYPDIQTRRLVHLLSTTSPGIPIFALMDYDPDGLGILFTYKHGSINLAHERHVVVPSMKWLGVRNLDFLYTKEDVQGLLTLTKRDRKMAEKLLKKQENQEGETQSDVHYRAELQMMLMLNVKAEIQILGNGEKLRTWLDVRLSDATISPADLLDL